MQKTASLTLCSRISIIVMTGILSLLPMLISGQTFSQDIEANLSDARLVTNANEEPVVCATLALRITNKSQRINGHVDLHGLTINSAHPTTGWFTIFDAQDDTIFTGRWFATSFRNSTTLISLEGRGDGQFTRQRLKLKIRAHSNTAEIASLLAGEGSGEIR